MLLRKISGTLLAGAMAISISCVAQAEEVTLRFAHIWAPSHPFNVCGAEKMRDLLENDPSGLRLRVYPAEQLGTMAQLADSVAAGNVDLSVFGSSYLGTRYEPMNLFDSAYVFESVEDAERVNESEVGQKIWNGLLEETGIRRLDNWLYGARHVTANVPVKSPEDLAGIKFRVPDNALMIENAKAIGATPVPMAFGEVYLGLQQGAIDAQENPVTVIDSQKFHEVQDYLSLTSHMIQVSPIVISEKSWQKLSDEQKGALERVISEVTPQVNKCVADEEASLLDKWRNDKTIQIVEPEEINLEAFREKAREHILAVYGDSEWGSLYRDIQESK